MSLPVSVTLLFSDGISYQLSLAAGQGLVEAAKQHGINLLTDCANGQCGTCTAHLSSGAIDMSSYDRAILPDDERQQGTILPCVCHVTTPCVVEFPYESSEATSSEPPPIPGVLKSKTSVGSDTVRLEVSIPNEISFQPGQFVHIQPDGSDFQRSYSMASIPGSDHLEFFIRLVPGGKFSDWLISAKPGATLELSAPRGTFFLRDENCPRLFIAGGTGIAPFLSMLRSMSPDSVTQPITLLIGVRTEDQLIALSEIQNLIDTWPNFELKIAVEKSNSQNIHLSGYATDLIKNLKLKPTTRIYMCGPPPMVEAAKKEVVALGFKSKDVLCERFA